MPPTIASPRRLSTASSRPATRATKRPRLSVPSLRSSKNNKRKYDDQAPPSVRKRRPSTAPTPPPAKRVRQVINEAQQDIEMSDPIPTRRARRKTLKDVLRSHIIKHAVLDIPVTPFIPANTSRAANASQPAVVQDQSDVRTQCSQIDQASAQVYLTGDEQVDVIDISEATTLEEQTETSDENPLQAHLLEDGRCFVRIARQDGTIDYYTLNPHQ